MVPGTRWVKLTDWSRTSTKLAVREGMHGAPSHPTKRLHKSPCSPSAAKILSLRGAKIAAPCGARYLSWGEARRKRRQVRTKSTKTRSSPRRFWKSRSRSSILRGAPARQLAIHWATPGEQWLLPLRHSSSGAWLKPCPLVGDRVRSASHPHRSLRRPLPRRLFASAPAAHAPAAARRFPSSCTRPRRPPPSTPLVATLTAAAGRTPCRHGVDPGQQWNLANSL